MTEAGERVRQERAARRPVRVLGTRKVPRAVRQSQMLEVAGRVFAARGFHLASMDEIADAADISKPMLYNYFGSKEGLYFAYIDLAYRELIAAIDEAVAAAAAAGEGPAGQLRTGVHAYYRFVGDHQDAFRVLFREVGDPGGELEHQRRRLRRRLAGAIDAILAEDVGAPRRVSSEALADAFLGAARSMADWWLDNDQVPAAGVADELTDLMLAGLRAPRG